MIIPIAAGLVCVNALTFTAFWADKQRAIHGLGRISEKDLLTLALLGGSPAALFARQLLRHKTKKQPFSWYLRLIIIAQGAILAAILLSR